MKIIKYFRVNFYSNSILFLLLKVKNFIYILTPLKFGLSPIDMTMNSYSTLAPLSKITILSAGQKCSTESFNQIALSGSTCSIGLVISRNWAIPAPMRVSAGLNTWTSLGSTMMISCLYKTLANLAATLQPPHPPPTTRILQLI